MSAPLRQRAAASIFLNLAMMMTLALVAFFPTAGQPPPGRIDFRLPAILLAGGRSRAAWRFAALRAAQAG